MLYHHIDMGMSMYGLICSVLFLGQGRAGKDAGATRGTTFLDARYFAENFKFTVIIIIIKIMIIIKTA